MRSGVTHQVEERDRTDLWRGGCCLALVLLAGLAATCAMTVVTTRDLAGRDAREDARARAGMVAAVLAAAESADLRPFLEQLIPPVARLQAVRHVVVWSEDGRVVWSDLHHLVGQHFDLADGVADLFREGGALVAGAAPGRVEPAPASAGSETTYEVFTSVSTRGGDRYVLEAYVDAGSVEDHRRETFTALLPFGLIVLVLVLGASVASGCTLLRHVRRHRLDRLRLVSRSLRVVEQERRELASRLHDGVVQDLAGVRYALTSVAPFVSPNAPGRPRETLDRVVTVIAEEIADLRGLLGHLVVPEMESRELEQAVRALVRHLVPSEVRCRVRVEAEGLSAGAATAAYRICREGVVNALKHGRPGGDIEIEVVALEGCARVVVTNDGLEPPASRRPGHGHVGLSLLRDLVTSQGGTLELVGRAEGGARLIACLPGGLPARQV